MSQQKSIHPEWPAQPLTSSSTQAVTPYSPYIDDVATLEHHDNVNINYRSDISMLGLAPTATFAERRAVGAIHGRFTGPTEKLDQYLKKPGTVPLIGFLIHAATLTDRNTGDIRDVLRTVLLLEGDRRLSTTSATVVRYIRQNLIPLFGLDDNLCFALFPEPVTIRIDAQETSRGLPTFALQIVED